MKLHSLPRGLVVLVAGLIVTTPAFADDVDPTAAKAAQKLFAQSAKAVESVFKSETKAALDVLTGELKALAKELKAELADGDTPAKRAKELFDDLDEFMGSLNESMRAASDQLVADAAEIINDVDGYPDGFVIGGGDGLDVAQSRLHDQAEKLVANATKRAASVQKALLKNHGYRTHIGLYLQTLPSQVPVVDGVSIIQKRNWAPAVQLFVSGRTMAADPQDGVIHLSGIFDAGQSFSQSPVGVSLTGPGNSAKGGPVEPEPNGSRWSTTFLDLQSDGGDGDGVPMLKRGNYIATVAHKGFYWVTCAVGVP